MRKSFLILVLIILLILGASKIHSRNAPKNIKNENIISIAHLEIFKELEYGKVLFKHQKHVEAMAKHLKKEEVQVCNECHKINNYGEYAFDFPVKKVGRSPEEVKNEYHRECLICHQKLSAQNKKTGPEILFCRDCHRKDYELAEVKYPIFNFDFAIHDKHVKKLEKDCSLCHHIYDLEEENKELMLVYEEGKEQSCYYCHDLSKKRGPELSKIVNVSKQKELDMEKSCHQLCLNCHIQNKKNNKEAGPIVCSECHTGKYRDISELREVPRPFVNQPEISFINIEGAKMRGVHFKHSFHEKENTTCRVCHHETLKACKECHDLRGKKEGGFVSIATAYHTLNSDMSCHGCHRKLINRKECMGCHYFIVPPKAEIGNNKMCEKCHTGKTERQELVKSNKGKSEVGLLMSKLPHIKEEVIINHIEREFEPTKMPHGKIIRKLTNISDQSRVATYFHGTFDSICRGCHHKSKETAEVEKEKPPLCVSCHSKDFSSKDLTRPRLQSAYHSMCIKCHESMEIEKPKFCIDCHERKERQNVHN